MKRTLAAVVILSAGLAVADASAPTGPRGPEILSAISSRTGPGHLVGIVAATIGPDGRTSMAAAGDAGPGTMPLDGDTVFEIGSITKVFTATLLADMVDHGEVKLDDPVALYLPPTVHVPERDGKKITLLDLSTQTSGLPRLPNNLRPADQLNPYADYTVAQLYAFLSSYTLTRDIGAQYEYSNIGVGLLGHALALRAGKSYEAILTERVLRPLHMNHTAIALTPWMKAHLALGHNAEGKVTPNWDLPTLAGAGALRSTMNDMLLFLRANLDPASSRLARVMQMTHQSRRPTSRPDMTIGLTWHIRRVDGDEVTWHNGGTGGYRTWIGFDAAHRTGAVVLTNSQESADDLGLALAKQKF